MSLFIAWVVLRREYIPAFMHLSCQPFLCGIPPINVIIAPLVLGGLTPTHVPGLVRSQLPPSKVHIV